MITQTKFMPPLDDDFQPAGIPRGAAWLRRLKSSSLRYGATGLNSLFGRRRHGFGILMYHRITAVLPDVAEPTWNVTPERFEEQLQGLLNRGFKPWKLRDALAQQDNQTVSVDHGFVVTFDDAYGNVFTNAFPVLQRLAIPATVFIATAYLDSERPFPFDDWSMSGDSRVPAEAWLPLTTEQCRQMQASGLIELAAHTHSHADFRNKPEALTDDLKRNLTELRERFELTDATFAFPYGTSSLGFAGPPLNEAVRQAGLLCALSTDSELVTADSDRFAWGRFTAEQEDSPASLAAKLNGWYERLRRLWRGRSQSYLQDKAAR